MAAKKTKETTRKPRETQKYVRNLRNAQVALRTGERPNIKFINLQPRGNRGDCAPISKEQLSEANFRQDEGLLYEIISAAEARDVIEKQTYNQQSAHPALAGLRNDKGEVFTKGVVVEESNEAQGKVVAHLDVDHNRPRAEIGITRMNVPGTIDNPLPAIPDDVEPEQVADYVARQKGTEGVGAGLAGFKVTTEPVQKS